jgi:hypothetical protein
MMEYFMEDVRVDIDAFLPDTWTDKAAKDLGLPEDTDLSVFFGRLKAFKTGLNGRFATMDSSFVFERQQLQVCQLEGPDFLRLWSGNVALNEDSLKRLTF